MVKSMSDVDKFDAFYHFESIFEKGKNIIFKAILEEYPVEYRPYLYKTLQSTKVFFSTSPDLDNAALQYLIELETEKVYQEAMDKVQKLFLEYHIEDTEENRTLLLSSIGASGSLEILTKKTSSFPDLKTIKCLFLEDWKKIVSLFGGKEEAIRLQENNQKEREMDSLLIDGAVMDRICSFNDALCKNQDDYYAKKAYVLEYYKNRYFDIFSKALDFEESRKTLYSKYGKELFDFLDSMQLLSLEDKKRQSSLDFDILKMETLQMYFDDFLGEGIYERILKQEGTFREQYFYEQFIKENKLATEEQLQTILDKRSELQKKFLTDLYEGEPCYQFLCEEFGSLYSKDILSGFLREFKDINLPAFITNLHFEKSLDNGEIGYHIIVCKPLLLWCFKSSIWNTLIHEYIHAITQPSWQEGISDEIFTQYQADIVWNKIKDQLEQVTGFVDYNEVKISYETLFPYAQEMLENPSNQLYDLRVRSTFDTFKKQYKEEEVNQYFSYLDQISSAVMKGEQTSEMMCDALQYMENYKKK